MDSTEKVVHISTTISRSRLMSFLTDEILFYTREWSSLLLSSQKLFAVQYRVKERHSKAGINRRSLDQG